MDCSEGMVLEEDDAPPPSPKEEAWREKASKSLLSFLGASSLLIFSSSSSLSLPMVENGLFGGAAEFMVTVELTVVAQQLQKGEGENEGKRWREERHSYNDCLLILVDYVQ